MPIYAYEPETTDRTCANCHKGFEHLQRSSDEPLRACLDCGNPVRRVISAPNIAASGPSLDSQNVERHGFTRYERAEKGVYEKTAGKGPDIITDD
ncbi:MAG: zinc ribbon domain-containing protein [Xanthomonadales bacterium]|nr:zinc ribbon domain-containing protein [Xanthomonadales bacterium]